MYFSDGAGSQYKNCKNFVKLCLHQEDFGVSAEWHFYATSNGKGACDGLGSTLKRLAARTSLQRPYNDQIMTPRQPYNWAKVSIPNIHFNTPVLKTTKRNQKKLHQRFLSSQTIPGTHKYHSFVKLKCLFTTVLLYQKKRWLYTVAHNRPVTRVNLRFCHMCIR